MTSLPRLLITMGDVAGIGPEIIARAWPTLRPICSTRATAGGGAAVTHAGGGSLGPSTLLRTYAVPRARGLYT